MYENDNYNNMNNEETNQTVTNEPVENKKKKLLVIIGGLVIVIVVLIIFAVTLLGTTKKNDTDVETVKIVELSDVDKVVDLTEDSFTYKAQYASKLYLVDNKLYALLTGTSNLKYDNNSIIVDNNKLYFVRKDVKDVLQIVDAETGYKNAVIIDKKGKTLKMNLIYGKGEPFELSKAN